MADEYKEALLEKQTTYHEGCPGCKVEKMKQLRRGYPYLELSFVWIVVLSTCKCFFVSQTAFILLNFVSSIEFGVRGTRLILFI